MTTTDNGCRFQQSAESFLKQCGTSYSLICKQHTAIKDSTTHLLLTGLIARQRVSWLDLHLTHYAKGCNLITSCNWAFHTRICDEVRCPRAAPQMTWHQLRDYVRRLQLPRSRTLRHYQDWTWCRVFSKAVWYFIFLNMANCTTMSQLTGPTPDTLCQGM